MARANARGIFDGIDPPFSQRHDVMDLAILRARISDEYRALAPWDFAVKSRSNSRYSNDVGVTLENDSGCLTSPRLSVGKVLLTLRS
jgi:hypothetical protein